MRSMRLGRTVKVDIGQYIFSRTVRPSGRMVRNKVIKASDKRLRVRGIILFIRKIMLLTNFCTANIIVNI